MNLSEPERDTVYLRADTVLLEVREADEGWAVSGAVLGFLAFGVPGGSYLGPKLFDDDEYSCSGSGFLNSCSEGLTAENKGLLLFGAVGALVGYGVGWALGQKWVEVPDAALQPGPEAWQFVLSLPVG